MASLWILHVHNSLPMKNNHDGNRWRLLGTIVQFESLHSLSQQSFFLSEITYICSIVSLALERIFMHLTVWKHFFGSQKLWETGIWNFWDLSWDCAWCFSSLSFSLALPVRDGNYIISIQYKAIHMLLQSNIYAVAKPIELSLGLLSYHLGKRLNLSTLFSPRPLRVVL